jgi:hypothetical protein
MLLPFFRNIGTGTRIFLFGPENALLRPFRGQKQWLTY